MKPLRARMKDIHLIKRGHLKLTTEPARSVIGKKKGKLKTHKAARVINSNFGIALGPEPTLIPFHNVTAQLKDLRRSNDGTLPEIIRNGSLIEVASGTWKGRWMVSSVKESKAYGLSVDLIQPSCPNNKRAMPKFILCFKTESVYYSLHLQGLHKVRCLQPKAFCQLHLTAIKT